MAVHRFRRALQLLALAPLAWAATMAPPSRAAVAPAVVCQKYGFALGTPAAWHIDEPAEWSYDTSHCGDAAKPLFHNRGNTAVIYVAVRDGAKYPRVDLNTVKRAFSQFHTGSFTYATLKSGIRFAIGVYDYGAPGSKQEGELFVAMTKHRGLLYTFIGAGLMDPKTLVSPGTVEAEYAFKTFRFTR